MSDIVDDPEVLKFLGSEAPKPAAAPQDDPEVLKFLQSQTSSGSTSAPSRTPTSLPSWLHNPLFAGQEVARGVAELGGLPGSLWQAVKGAPVNQGRTGGGWLPDSVVSGLDALPTIGQQNAGFDKALGDVGGPLTSQSRTEDVEGFLGRNFVLSIAPGLGEGSLAKTGLGLLAGEGGAVATEAAAHAGWSPLGQVVAGTVAGLGIGGGEAATQAFLNYRTAQKAALAAAAEHSAATASVADASLAKAQGKHEANAALGAAEDSRDALRAHQTEVETQNEAARNAALAPLQARLDQRDSAISTLQEQIKTAGMDDPNLPIWTKRLQGLQGSRAGFVKQIGSAMDEVNDKFDQDLENFRSQLSPLVGEANKGVAGAKRSNRDLSADLDLDIAKAKNTLFHAKGTAQQTASAVKTPLEMMAGGELGGLLAGPLHSAFGLDPYTAWATGQGIGAGAALLRHAVPGMGNPLPWGGGALGALPGLFNPGKPGTTP